jgi:hypothetical protein
MFPVYLLQAETLFFSVMSFNFNAFRFRMRGYDGDMNTTLLNGIPMDNLDNGFTPFGLWGGLNDVMRNRDVSLGLRPSTFAFWRYCNFIFYRCKSQQTT